LLENTHYGGNIRLFIFCDYNSAVDKLARMNFYPVPEKIIILRATLGQLNRLSVAISLVKIPANSHIQE